MIEHDEKVLWELYCKMRNTILIQCRLNYQVSLFVSVFWRYVLPYQILLPPIETVGSTIPQ